MSEPQFQSIEAKPAERFREFTQKWMGWIVALVSFIGAISQPVRDYLFPNLPLIGPAIYLAFTLVVAWAHKKFRVLNFPDLIFVPLLVVLFAWFQTEMAFNQVRSAVNPAAVLTAKTLAYLWQAVIFCYLGIAIINLRCSLVYFLSLIDRGLAMRRELVETYHHSQEQIEKDLAALDRARIAFEESNDQLEKFNRLAPSYLQALDKMVADALHRGVLVENDLPHFASRYEKKPEVSVAAEGNADQPTV